MLGIQEITVLVIRVIKLSRLKNPGLPPRGFLQTKRLISLVVFLFCKIQEKAIASCCLLLATPMFPGRIA